MEIRGLGINATPATVGTARLRETSAPSAPAPEMKGATLSPTGQLFLLARRALAEQPEVRSNLVQGLARQVQSGRYTINADQVAAALAPEG